MDGRCALDRNPELAQLWSLHFASRMALRTLDGQGSEELPLVARPALVDLRTALEGLIGAVERYRSVVELEPADTLQVRLPEHWSPAQADAVIRLLGEVAVKVERNGRGGRSRRSAR